MIIVQLNLAIFPPPNSGMDILIIPTNFLIQRITFHLWRIRVVGVFIDILVWQLMWIYVLLRNFRVLVNWWHRDV